MWRPEVDLVGVIMYIFTLGFFFLFVCFDFVIRISTEPGTHSLATLAGQQALAILLSLPLSTKIVGEAAEPRPTCEQASILRHLVTTRG